MQAQATITLPAELTELIHSEVRQTVAEMMHAQPKAQTDAPDFLNLGQAADFLGISRGTLTKLINQGDVKVTFIGTAKRISKAQLIKFMASREV
ncbi:helix-turn-helix domain-containing protein [Lacticaseibacillus baoqingensis]|uniref:Helix-turn-helix domain-containing protein n=1 Tax=Lacticaseibacillus baoqingensis TaxID=2486013 RepID=A0ABW4E1N7_9LACO|nr:helix-turn-helix domain-containing protein [Lacticaseibacillus baoqingensis]